MQVYRKDTVELWNRCRVEARPCRSDGIGPNRQKLEIVSAVVIGDGGSCDAGGVISCCNSGPRNNCPSGIGDRATYGTSDRLGLRRPAMPKNQDA